MPKKNIYTHEIELRKIKIINSSKESFVAKLEELSYRGYEVEQISDGRKIVITKPGGKFVFGKIKREDFMVFVFNPIDNTLWLISHKDILNDLITKGNINPNETIKIINALEEVFNGAEPDNVTSKGEIINPIGENPEILLKAYKWIWGQEDINYPTGKGRQMSMDGILELKTRLMNM
ncbi:MAG: hypothetical protein JW908_17230 [Anaerolineales bacterium]|nr:hypothetical protein [Anaerolineales bacterium]